MALIIFAGLAGQDTVVGVSQRLQILVASAWIVVLGVYAATEPA